MTLLLVSATLPEISPLLASLSLSKGENIVGNHTVYVLITGVGMVATAFAMGYQLANNHYDLALNLGIAGSFDRSIALGEVVHITDDHFAELGAEDGDEFISIDELGFADELSAVSYQLSAHELLPDLRKVKGITVSKVHGNEFSIAKTMERLHPQVESMEGAAFLYACAKKGVPALQVRAISNYVERRNKAQWEIGLAIRNLCKFAEEFLPAIA